MKLLITTLASAATISAAGATPIADALAIDPANPPLSAVFLPIPDIDIDDKNFAESLSIAGDYAFAGAPASYPENTFSNPTTDDADPGAVYVYRRSGSVWSIAQVLRPGDADAELGFGVSVDVSEDGETLVVGCDDYRQQDNATPLQGGVYVYRRDAAGSYQFAQKLVPPGAEPLQRTGLTVEISGDWIALGAPYAGAGKAYLFANEDGSWKFRQEFASPMTGDFDSYGIRVAIDGDDFAVSSLDMPGTSGDGKVQLYRRDGDYWVDAAEFSNPDPDPTSEFGYRLSLQDGRLWVTYRWNSDATTTNFYYDRNGTTWTAGTTLSNQTQALGPGRTGLDAAGNIAVVSGNRNDDSLALAEVFVLDGGSYTSQLVLGDLVGQLPVPSGIADPWQDSFGAQEIATDGETILFDFYPDGSGSGYGAFLCAITPGASPDPTRPIREALFYADAPEPKADAAFAYQRLMYTPDGNDFEIEFDISSTYTQNNRDAADRAEAALRLAYSPGASEELRAELEELYLDLAYGRAAAELILAREELDQAERRRLDGTPDSAGDLFFLDSEIARVRTALDHTAAAINIYTDLFEDDLGIPAIDGITTGRSIFATHTPDRALGSPLDAAGNPINGTGDDLLASHKDLALLHDILLQHTRTAAQLAYLLTTKADPASDLEVRTLAGDITRLVFEQRLLADAMFPDMSDAQRSDLGLSELSTSTDAALTELAAFTQNLDGTINLFGYEPDFLFLINGSDDGIFNSFDNFKDRLDPTDTESVLNDALVRRTAAIGYLANYHESVDTLDAEWGRIVSDANDGIIPRLIAIVGVAPPGSFPPDPASAYANPQDNEGSDISLQYDSIEIARNRIARNSAEIQNLRQEINIEHQRRAVERGINASLSDLIIDFGNQQYELTQEIGRIEAIQAGAESLAEGLAIDKLNPITAYGTVVNAGIQAAGEHDKALLEGAKERLAASQEAAVRDADDDILDNNSKAFIKTRLLEMNTLSIDTQEAVLLLRQEAGRLVALTGEQADLERRLVEVRDRLASRHAADPVHRLRALHESLIADISYREARRWLFFMARALEYKWNTPFALTGQGSPDGIWDIDDLFKMRNAEELDRFYDAMVFYDNTRGINRNQKQLQDGFSLREDFFGYKEQSFDDAGQPVTLSYDVVNPDTGALETGVDAITAFRYALEHAKDDQNFINLRFDTVRETGFEIDGDGFGEFGGTFFDPVNYLDRIETVQVIIPGQHSVLGASNSDNTIQCELTYAGTTFMRLPTLSNSGPDPTLRPGELVSYPANLLTTSESDSSVFVSQDGLIEQAAAVKLPPGVGVNQEVAEDIAGISSHSITKFTERAVAATEWTLRIRERNTASSASHLQIDEIDDIVLWFNHVAVQRGQ